MLKRYEAIDSKGFLSEVSVVLDSKAEHYLHVKQNIDRVVQKDKFSEAGMMSIDKVPRGKYCSISCQGKIL